MRSSFDYDPRSVEQLKNIVIICAFTRLASQPHQCFIADYITVAPFSNPRLCFVTAANGFAFPQLGFLTNVTLVFIFISLIYDVLNYSCSAKYFDIKVTYLNVYFCAYSAKTMPLFHLHTNFIFNGKHFNY